MLKILSIIVSLVFSTSLFAAVEELPKEVRSKEYSLSKKGLALKGYDPVTYFQDGPSKGSSRVVYDFKGVVYWFINEVNRAEFIKKPSKYEPEYGGWCAWAMSDGGGRTEANPESFKIIDGKLYVFYDGFFGNTLKQWNSIGDDEGLIEKADKYWSDQVSK